jgi:DNA-binding MarR family transcriptional regulator
VDATPDDRRATQTAAAVDAVRRIFRALRVAAQQTHSSAGISAAQLYVLSSLSDGSAASLTELGRRTHTDRTSVADVVERLAIAGLVKRTRSQEDRRRMDVRITAAGRVVLRNAPQPPTALLVAGMDALPDRELDALVEGLKRLAREMGLEAAPAPMLFEDETGRRPPARKRIRNG